MRLRSLRLQGFKSFPDPTDIRFHRGVTAIVGPNGCGKSNISDAIRWVLGEQRPTQVRGARMEEVIFQGTATRRRLSRGAVTMVVSNEDGSLPVPWDEVEIGRVVYRDGGSEYSLNRSSCRLRDVVDLCRDTGLGANAYSMIEIRMIDDILSERPDERRRLFEEAAGVGKYKERRRAATRRLEDSETDLQRIEDVIGEVQTKVRSLARQKGKAQRHADLRDRRLALEVALARLELAGMEADLQQLQEALQRDREDDAGQAAARAASEAALESSRVQRIDAGRARGTCKAELDEVATELARRETEVAVAEERIANGSQRLERIAAERETLQRLEARKEREAAEQQELRDRTDTELAALATELDARSEAARKADDDRDAARQHLRELDDERRSLARRIARLEGDRDAAHRRMAEMEERIGRLLTEAEQGAGTLREIEEQGDLFVGHETAAAQAAAEAEAEVASLRTKLTGSREELAGAQEAERDADARVSSLTAEMDALDRIALSSEGLGALVEAVCDAFPTAVRGLLSDFVEASGRVARDLDGLLGPLASAIVVGTRAEAAVIARWYNADETRVAPLHILALDLPGADSEMPLPEGVGISGPEGRLAGLLLQGVVRAKEGEWIDGRGVIHLLPGAGSAGPLEQRARIRALETELKAARMQLETARRERTGLEAACTRLEAAREAATERLLAARDSVRAAAARTSSQKERRARLIEEQSDAERRLAGLRRALAEAGRGAAEAEAERNALAAHDKIRASDTEAGRRTLEVAEAAWERAREAASTTRLHAARLESRRDRAEEQLQEVATARREATEGLELLTTEESGIRVAMGEAARVREEGREALQDRFLLRDRLTERLAGENRRLEEAERAVAEAESGLRQLRAAERDSADRRHRLELHEVELRNRALRIGERMEAEWGRPVEALLKSVEPIEGNSEALQEELKERILPALERIGPVNMLAVEEHEEERARLDFLTGQRNDLVAARDDLRSAIRNINATASKRFRQTFEEAQGHFRSTFRRLFQGGQAELRLADPDDPLECPIEIHASPGGKRTRRIDQLSGGERALTALALLFGIYLVKPSPFCVLDEVDAPLDDTNIGRFIALLHSFKTETQFVVITHNPRTIAAADWIYGVTMEDPGISSIVGVQLDDPANAGSSSSSVAEAAS